MSKCHSTPNFDNIAQSTAVLLLVLIWENGHPLYWNYTCSLNVTYWSSRAWSRVLTFCTDASNLKFLAATVPEIWKVSKNFKSRSRDHFTTSDLIWISFVNAPSGQSACQIWSFYPKPFRRYGRGPIISKVGHVNPSRLPLT